MQSGKLFDSYVWRLYEIASYRTKNFSSLSLFGPGYSISQQRGKWIVNVNEYMSQVLVDYYTKTICDFLQRTL